MNTVAYYRLVRINCLKQKFNDNIFVAYIYINYSYAMFLYDFCIIYSLIFCRQMCTNRTETSIIRCSGSIEILYKVYNSIS